MDKQWKAWLKDLRLWVQKQESRSEEEGAVAREYAKRLRKENREDYLAKRQGGR
jgi:hypothetical protein